MIDLYLKIKIQ